MKVLVYPKDKNPYQDLLYKNISEEIKVEYLTNPTSSHIIGLLLLPFLLILYRIRGFQIFHLHWVYTFQITAESEIFHTKPFQLVFMLYFFFILIILKVLNFRIIWTVHDIVPHGRQFLDDLLVSKVLAYFSNGKIAHSQETINQMSSFGLSTKNTEIIPIGNYSTVYPRTISKAAARAKLKIDPQQFVYAFFGRIEYYKGILPLLETFRKIDQKDAILLIAGPCADAELKEIIENHAVNDHRIRAIIEFIPDDEVQSFVLSSDIFVFPFSRITTSSSVVLAMSFERSVIIPLLGEMVDIPKNAVFHYDPKDTSSLKRTMEYAYANPKAIQVKEKNAFSFAKQNSWESISKKTAAFYENVLAQLK